MNKTVYINIPIKSTGQSISATQAAATRKFMQTYTYKKAKNHGFEKIIENENRTYYQYEYTICELKK